MNILITAGGTTEKIDDVRKITNSATGRLGATIADCFADFDAVNKIYYICSEKAKRPNNKITETLVADNTMALENVVHYLCATEQIDVVVHSMAVSDYRVNTVSTAEVIADNICSKISDLPDSRLAQVKILGDESREPETNESSIRQLVAKTIIEAETIVSESPAGIGGKISSDNDNLVIVMEKTPKIISLFRKYLPNALIFGFKLLVDVTESTLIDVAFELLNKNDCDYVVANDLKTTGQDNHVAHIVDRDKNYKTFLGKAKIAEAICSITMEERIEK